MTVKTNMMCVALCAVGVVACGTDPAMEPSEAMSEQPQTQDSTVANDGMLIAPALDVSAEAEVMDQEQPPTPQPDPTPPVPTREATQAECDMHFVVRIEALDRDGRPSQTITQPYIYLGGQDYSCDTSQGCDGVDTVRVWHQRMVQLDLARDGCVQLYVQTPFDYPSHPTTPYVRWSVRRGTLEADGCNNGEVLEGEVRMMDQPGATTHGAGAYLGNFYWEHPGIDEPSYRAFEVWKDRYYRTRHNDE